MGDCVREDFPRQVRLLTANDFQQVFKNNQRFGDAHITLLVRKTTSSCSRLGFAIAKKQIKKAVDRNRLKRVFRQSFRVRQTELPNRDVVIMVKHKILTLSKQQINELIERQWNMVIRKCEKS